MAVPKEIEEKASPFLASEIVRDELSNGMKVLVKQVYPAQVASLGIWVRVGSVNESDRVAGISHFIEHMLFKGTKKRPVGTIAKEIHGCGGYMNAFTDYECTCYWIVLPSKYLDVALDVQADAFLNSMFDAEEIEKECQVIIEELKMYEDRPEAFSFEKLMPLAYREHPYGRPIIGFEETLRKTKRQDIVDYFHHHYQANNMFVTLVGDVAPSRAIGKIKKAFKEFPNEPVHNPPLRIESPQREFRQEEMEGEIARTHLQTAFHIPDAVHEDLHALRVLATLLGEGKSSRLNRNLRETHQWVDSAQAGIFAQQNPGLFYTSLVLEDRSLEKAESELWNEINRLKEEPVPEEELKKAQNMTESEQIFSQETVEGQGRNLGYYEILGDYLFGETILKRIFAVTPQEIQAAARKYFRKENASQIVYHAASR